jgi:hypothetical protein
LLNFFSLAQGWQQVPRSQNYFSPKFYCMWKPEFISIIFPITPVISERPLQTGAPGSCTAGPPFSPALNTRTLDRYKYTIHKTAVPNTKKVDTFSLCLSYNWILLTYHWASNVNFAATFMLNIFLLIFQPFDSIVKFQADSETSTSSLSKNENEFFPFVNTFPVPSVAIIHHVWQNHSSAFAEWTENY